jgi:small-conductance mechanosensitive channel/CRP-like cAMP-binding protein
VQGVADQVRSRLEQLAPARLGAAVVVVSLLVLLGLRLVLPPPARARTQAPAVLLLLALAFRLVGGALQGFGFSGAAGVLNVLAILFLVLGATGVAAVLLFDVVLRRRPVAAVVRDLTQYVLAVGIVLAMLSQSGVDAVSIVATGGVLTAVIGFALQSTIANVFAGVALPFEGEVRMGDWIRVGEHVGNVREIKWRATTILTRDGDIVVVPNNQLLTTDVTNYSRPTPAHRMRVTVGVHYRHPPNDVKAVLLEAVRGVPGVLVQPPPDAAPLEFADSAVVYRLRYWIADFSDEITIDGEVRTRVWYATRRAGLEMPFPIRTIVPSTEQVPDGASMRRAALDRVDLFATLDTESRGRLAGDMREQHFAAGEDIVRQDEPGDSLFVIARGDVEVRLSTDTVSRRVATLGSGQIFGEMSLVLGEPRAATCTALTDTVCYVIDRFAFGALLAARPEVADDVSARLAERQVGLEASRERLTAAAREQRTRDTRSAFVAAIRRAFRS